MKYRSLSNHVRKYGDVLVCWNVPERKTLVRLSGGLAVVVGIVVTGCGAGQDRGEAAEPAAAEDTSEVITADGLLEHISVLASDEFEGRAPGGRGEDLTVRYLIEQFRGLGLAPGNPDGTYTQGVPLVSYTAQPEAELAFGDEVLRPQFPNEYVARSRRFGSEAEVEVQASELVFVGYGVVAPEYDWDDYKGVDMSGKTLVMLVNDPPVPDPADPARLDAEFFRGEAMTYYGRWTYKYEIAEELGAAAAIVVHETEPAGYPYDVIESSFAGEQFDIVTDDSAERLAVEAWINEATARAMVSAAGHDFDELKAAAARPDFEPVPLGGTADFRVTTTVTPIASDNVIARLEGSDPELRDEHVVYTAHWDHIGMDPALEGDQIYNGAVDNASGIAGVLEIARAFAELQQPPARSIIFLAVTAEERGLLGAKYYAENPLYPLETTLANINLDGLNQWGRTRDIVVIGYGNSTLDDALREQAALQGRTVRPDPEPEKGFFYRSDHFEFAKQGVPALYTDSGVEYIDKPVGYGEEKRAEYTANDYHNVSDEVKPDWDLAGAAEDMRLLFAVGQQVANGADYPEWNLGTEFRAIREEMLGQAR